MASPAPPQLDDSRRRYWHDQLGSGDSATASGVTSYAVPVTLGVLLLVGVIGNGSIVYTVCKHRRMKNVPNAFVVNVAVADLLLLFAVSPFVASYYIFDDWLLGGFVCKLTEAMQTFCAALATLSVTALSIERYCAFASPPRRRRVARRRACVGIAVMWILAAVAALPDAMSALVEHRVAATAGGGGSERTLRRCTTFTEAWGPLYPRIHTIVSACLLFGVPLLLVSVFYMSLGCVVCGKKRRERRRLQARGAGGGADAAAPSQRLKSNGALAVNGGGGGGCGLAESAVDGSPAAGATATMTRNGSGALPLLPAYKTGTVSTIARTGTMQSGPGGGGTLVRSSDRDRKKDSRTSLIQRQRRSTNAMKRRKTMAKVAVLLCFQFAALWAPRYAYHGWFYFAAPTPDEIAGHWAIVYLVGRGAIFLNAALVPFTVISFNRAFRRRLAKYLCCCCSGCGTCCCLDDDEDDANNEEVGGGGATRRRRRGASCCSPCCADGDSDDDDDVDELESDYPMSTATSGYRPTNYLDPYELGIAGDAAAQAAGGGVGVPAAAGPQAGYDPRYEYGAVGGGGAATTEGLYGTRSLLSDFAYFQRPTMADTVHYAEPALLRYHPLSSGLLHPDQQQQQQHLTLQQQQPQHYYVDPRYAPGPYRGSIDASPQQQQHMQRQFQQQSPTERRSMAVATAASPVRLGAGEVHCGADTAVPGSQAEPPPPPAMFDSAEDQAAAAAAAEEAVAAAAGAGPAPGVYI